MTTPGKPFQSKLIPYRKEIAELRKTWPPTTYKEIAKILNERHGIKITANSIWSFVKIRALNPAKQVYTLPEEPEPISHTFPAAPPSQTSLPANSISENYQRALRKPRTEKPLFTDNHIIH